MSIDSKPFVPINGVADYFAVSVSTIRAWVRNGDIPKSTYIKVGNTYRFNLKGVSEALTGADEVGTDNAEAVVAAETIEVSGVEATNDVADLIHEVEASQAVLDKDEATHDAYVGGDIEAEQEINLDDDI